MLSKCDYGSAPEPIGLDSANDRGPSIEFRFSSLIFSVFVPTILFGIGQGAVMPIIPLFAIELGATDAEAAFLAGLVGIGQIAFAVPAGLVVSKMGDKVAMVAGTFLIGVVAVGGSLSPNKEVFAVCSFLLGGGWGFWNLARLVFVSEAAPQHVRGRAMSMLGGMNRIGNFIGPVVGGFLGEYLGLYSAFLAQAAFGLLASALMFVTVTPHYPPPKEGHGLCKGLALTLRGSAAVLLRLTYPIFALNVLRQARQVFLPLWGASLELSVVDIGIVTSVSFFADSVTFLPSGWVLDNLGRLWCAAACIGGLSLGFVLLPLSYEFWTFLLIGALMGVGNGFGAGINMTWGADFSPSDRKGEFLGVWRLISDCGTAFGPLMIGVVMDFASLSVSSLSCAGCGLLGVLVVLLFVPETLAPERRRCTRRYGRLTDSTG